MADVDVAQWLEQWLEENVPPAGHAGVPSDTRETARRCAADAEAAGINATELQGAAGGDLDTFLVERQGAASAQAGSAADLDPSI